MGMTKLVPLLAALVFAGCGAGEPDPPPEPPVAGPAEPAGPPPTVGDEVSAGPPPAWIETEDGSYWLAYSSYCWKTTCVDYVAIADRDDVPTVPVREGELVRFHLGFEPSELSLSYGSTDLGIPQPRAERVAEWRATIEGGLWLFARAATGQGGADASYVVRLVFRE
jgi:hypothetical protein